MSEPSRTAITLSCAALACAAASAQSSLRIVGLHRHYDGSAYDLPCRDLAVHESTIAVLRTKLFIRYTHDVAVAARPFGQALVVGVSGAAYVP